MTDVVEIANKRRAALRAEIGRLDNFIRMAGRLVEERRQEPNTAPAPEDEGAAEVTDPAAAESTGPTTGHSYYADADGNDAETEHEDLSVRELKAGDLVRQPRTTLSEPTADRQKGMGLFRRGSA